MRILVTGGAGYIGSHTCVELINNSHEVIVVDNLANSSAKAIERVEHITNAKIPFYQDDLLDADEINKIFDEHQIDCVIHFAGLKAVGESVKKPLQYYTNNIQGTLNLLRVMNSHNVKNIVFSWYRKFNVTIKVIIFVNFKLRKTIIIKYNIFSIKICILITNTISNNC